ncbi:MAG: S41 family peptidase [Chitinophagaceae bacterium]
MAAFFDSLYLRIKDSLTETEFYNIITLLNSKIKDGHTMFLPGEKTTEYFNNYSKFFPFYIFIQDEKLYVNMNCSADTTIREGNEIVSINGKDVKDILVYLLHRQTRDGNNMAYPKWILTTYFKSYYGFSFGHPSSFSVRFKNEKKELKETTINALSNDSIRFYRQQKYASRNSEKNNKKGIFLEIDDQSSIATLTVPSFSNYLLKSLYNQQFKAEIEKHFKKIRDSKVKHLVIDLRNNQGGDWEPGRLLLSYLVRKPMKYLENSVQSKMINPAADNFTGDLYVLINGGSFSNSVIVSSSLEQWGRAVFIGEETGGNKTLINGEADESILPNTKIAIQISTQKFIIRNGINDGHGLVPSHYIKPGIEDVVADKDIVKEAANKLIQQQKEKQ